MRRALTRVAASAAVVLGTVAGVAAPAWAPKYIFTSSAYGDCLLRDRVSFVGDFTVESFSARDGELYVNASVMGSCVSGFDVVATVNPGVYAFPAALVTECVDTSAVLEVRPRAAAVAGVLGDPKTGEPAEFVLDLGSTVADRIWMEGDAEQERARLCAIDRAFRRGATATQLARLLNELTLRL